MNNQAEYSTRDIYISVILKSLNIPLLRIESNGRQGIFVFKSSEALENIISQYFNGELKLNPRTVFDNWKALKSQAFAAIGDTR
mgnify:CR=1 FL=1